MMREKVRMISVIIPAFNSEKTIIECVDSVLNQSRVDLVTEILIVDDGSNDSTVELIKGIYQNESRVRVICKQNGGVSSARNIGIKAAKSEWIALLDSDDVWLQEKLEKQWNWIEKRPDIAFIGTNRNKENIHYGTKEEEGLYSLNLLQVLIKMWPHTSTALIRKDVFECIGYFNENMRYAEDGDMWCRIALKHKLYYIAETLEVAGKNKATFGESGLSANLREMHRGNVRNLEHLKKGGYLNDTVYVSLKFYYYIKYIRRIIITKIRQLIK